MLRNQRRIVLPGEVVEVLLRRFDIGVTDPLLHPADVGFGDHPRSEGVAQSWKRSLRSPAPFKGLVVPTP
jgi:hypothetical protein